MTLFESIAAIIKVIATPRAASDGERIATAHVAKKLLDKAGAGELADIAELAENNERRRMDATTRAAEAQANAAEGQARKTEAEAFKTTLESMEIAQRMIASGNRDRPGSMPAAEEAFDKALSRLLQFGGSLPIEGSELHRIAAGSTSVSEPSAASAVVTPGTAELSFTGFAPTAEIKASVDVEIPIGLQATASVGDASQRSAAEIRTGAADSDADQEANVIGGEASSTGEGTSRAEGSAVLNTSPLNSFALNEAPLDDSSPRAAEDKVPFNSTARIANDIAARQWEEQAGAAAAANMVISGSAAHRFIPGDASARDATVEPSDASGSEPGADSPSV